MLDSISQVLAFHNHEKLLEIINLSRESRVLNRSEAAWNTMVHYPLLVQLTSHASSIRVEPITSAQIDPAFRPLANLDNSNAGSSSSAASVSSRNSTSEWGTDASSSKQGTQAVHKMVDFALVLLPDDDLEAGMKRYRSSASPQTVNQTMYYPLVIRPAPVFIETKTSAGSIEEANVQLGIWIAAWHQSMRRMIDLNGMQEKVITIPLLQVVNGVWTVMFALDAGAEIVGLLETCLLLLFKTKVVLAYP